MLNSSIYIPVFGLLGVVLASFAGYVVQRWRYRIDRLSASVDLVCLEINSAADLAASYWAFDLSQKDEIKEGSKIEPQMIGRQLRIQAIILALQNQDSKIRLHHVERLLFEYYDALTDGNFKVHNRAPDEYRIQKSQALAAELNGQLRTALSERTKKWL